jgi:hypothetical protein
VRNPKIYRNKSIKEKLSQVYLNFSEKKPFQKITFFRELKEFRDRQKKDAFEYYEKSKRPNGNDLRLHSFYLFENFFLEDLSELGKILDNLFAKSLFGSTHESYQSFLEQVANRPGRATLSLPLIINKKTGFIPSDRICLDHMPDFIKYIEPKLIKIMPSLVIMTIRVMLDEELVNAKINQVLDHVYQHRITFHTYLPWKTSKSGWTMYPPHHEKSEACRNVMKELKFETERFLAKYFQGFYLSKKGDSNRCPSLDVYTISQLPEDANIISWARSAQEFWRLLGFEYIFEKIWFKNDNSIFCIGSISGFPYVNKLIINKSSINGSASHGLSQSVPRISSNICEEYLAPITLISLFGELNENIIKLKTVFFSHMKKRRRPRFKKLVRIQNQVSINNIKIDNVILEYKKTPADDLRNGNIKLKDMSSEKTLSEVFSENVDYVIEAIKRILDPVKSYVIEYFSNENIRVNFLLQKSIVILTVAILLLTLLQFGPKIWGIIKAIFEVVLKIV